MNDFYLILGIFFAVSFAGIPLYTYISKQHFVRLRIQFMLQGLFWVVLSCLLVYSIATVTETISIILNSVLLVFSLLLTAYAITMIKKDTGAFVIPYAKDGNMDVFAEYVSSLDVAKVSIRTTNGKRYDVIEFTDVEEDTITQIFSTISQNEDIIVPLNSPEATKRLAKSFTFAVIMIAVAVVL